MVWYFKIDATILFDTTRGGRFRRCNLLSTVKSMSKVRPMSVAETYKRFLAGGKAKKRETNADIKEETR